MLAEHSKSRIWLLTTLCLKPFILSMKCVYKLQYGCLGLYNESKDESSDALRLLPTLDIEEILSKCLVQVVLVVLMDAILFLGA